MKVYATPAKTPEFGEYLVDGRYDPAKAAEVTERYLEEVRAWLRQAGYKHRLTGKVVRFPVADGAARYMIADGTSMVHLPIDDAWRIPAAHARGLRITDLAAQLDREEKWANR